MFLLCNEHHRRSLGSFCRKKFGCGKIKDQKHATPAVVEEPGHESNVPPSDRNDDDDPVFVPQTVYCLVEDELDTAVSKHDQDETKSIAQSRKDVVHEAFEKDANKMAGNTRRIKKSKGLKAKRVSLDQVEWDVSTKPSGTVTYTTYTEETQATASTRTSRGDNCVGATVDELGAAMFNAWTAQAKAKAHKGGIPAVISIRPEPAVMTLDSPMGCFNPVQTAMQVGAALELATSRTFSTKHRQLQNVRRVNSRSSRKRELRSYHGRIEMGNFSVSGDLDSIGISSIPPAGRNYPLQTVVENSIEMSASSQSFSSNTNQRQFQEASRSHTRKQQLRVPTSGSGLAKQCAVKRVDHLKNVGRRTNTHQRGLHTRPSAGSIVPFSSQCAILEVTKSMSEESKVEFALIDNPHYLYMKGSVSAESRYRS